MSWQPSTGGSVTRLGRLLDSVALVLVAGVDLARWLARRPLPTTLATLAVVTMWAAGPVALAGLGMMLGAVAVVWARRWPVNYRRWVGWRPDRVRRRVVARAVSWQGLLRLRPRPAGPVDVGFGPHGPVLGCVSGHHAAPRDAVGLCPGCGELLAGVADPAAAPGERMVWLDALDPVDGEALGGPRGADGGSA